ncbi:hypothetical protein Adt_33049 [Abeliophyllum distichum]|uniref:Uncharacterized protein n=1 Tax=Abeliophyllum distichum TaxID=126358 RepID=A0ABD1QX47_9LAMI
MHEHFRIPNFPTSNSGWKNRYFFVKLVDRMFTFLVDWSVLLLDEFNSTPILIEHEIDSLINLRTIEPFGRSINDVLTNDALVSAGIGRLYDMSANRFSEDFLKELARKNARGQRKRCKNRSSTDLPCFDVVPSIDHQELIQVDSSPLTQIGTLPTAMPKVS